MCALPPGPSENRHRKCTFVPLPQAVTAMTLRLVSLNAGHSTYLHRLSLKGCVQGDQAFSLRLLKLLAVKIVLLRIPTAEVQMRSTQLLPSLPKRLSRLDEPLNGATPVPGPIMMIGVAGSSGSAKPDSGERMNIRTSAPVSNCSK